MKTLILIVTVLIISMKTYGQGHVYFNTIFGGDIDARVVLPDGTGAGDGWIAQIWVETSVGEYEPVFPTTTFKTFPEAARGYVKPVDITIPEVPIEEMATLIVRAYDGANWDTSALRYESNPFTIRLEGGRLPPARMVGLEFFTSVPGADRPLSALRLTIRVVQSGRVLTIENAQSNSIIIERSSVLGSRNWEQIHLPVIDQQAEYVDNSDDPFAFFRMANNKNENSLTP